METATPIHNATEVQSAGVEVNLRLRNQAIHPHQACKFHKIVIWLDANQRSHLMNSSQSHRLPRKMESSVAVHNAAKIKAENVPNNTFGDRGGECTIQARS